MENILYSRIKELCEEHNISIRKLELELNLGISSISKWKNAISPSTEKLSKIANYFNVSVDYLLGLTETRENADQILADNELIAFQRARRKMSPVDREKAMQIIKIGFDYAFDDENNNEQNED